MAAQSPLRVGIAGAGAWAGLVTAPMLAAGPETTVSAIWSRRREPAADLAATHGTDVADSFDDLLSRSDAIAFAVPPDVQPDLAVRAAAAGKPLLLEKPLGVDVAGALRITQAVRDAAIPSLVLLTYRFRRATRTFLADLGGFDVHGARGCFFSGALLDGPFARGWRLERGFLLDVGPHMLDLLDVALGPVREIRAAGDPLGWVSLLLSHESGTTSEVAICGATRTPSRTEVEVFGPDGSLILDGRAEDPTVGFAAARRDFARIARTGEPHDCDAARGLHVQRLVAAAQEALTTGASVTPTP